MSTVFHYSNNGVVKRQDSRHQATLTVLVTSARDGLYLVMVAKGYAKGVPINVGEDILNHLASAFVHRRMKRAYVQLLTGDAQAIADQIAGLYYSQEEL